MFNKITTRYLTNKDQVNLFAFMRLAYNPKYILTDEKFFEWYTHPARLSVKDYRLPVIGAFWGDKLVGHIFVIPHYFSNKKEKVPMVWNSNFMVHPEFQQKGIGPMLIRRIFDDPDILISAGTGASLQQKGGRSILTAMGYNFAFMQKQVFLFKKEGLDLLREKKSADAEILEKNYSLLQSYHSCADQDINAVLVENFDNRVTDFWREFGASRFFGTWRDADFLNWRYFKHPIFTYRAMVVSDGKNKIRGMGVYRLAVVAGWKRPFTVARITEFLAEDGFGGELLSCMLKDMEEKEALWADFFTTTRTFDNVFSGLGFITDSEFTMRFPRMLQPLSYEDPGVNLVAKNIRDKESGSDFNDFANWYSTCADGDQDRPNASSQ